VPEPPKNFKLPIWLMAVLFGVGIVAVFAAVYSLVGSHGSGSSGAPSAAVDSSADQSGAKANPYQKYVEVAGVRFVEDKKDKNKTLARFVLVNHSEADISGLGGNLTLSARAGKSEVEAAGTCTFNTNLGPFESKEVTVPLITKLKIYELPDWQFVTTDLRITAPAQ
jgi:hypothetical protein